MNAQPGSIRFSYRPVRAATSRTDFRSGETDVDSWFRDLALKCEERGTVRVTCAHLDSNDAPIGFFAVATAVERVTALPGFHYHLFGDGKVFPCLQLVYVAVHQAFQGRGIGSTMVGAVIALFAEIGPRIGLPHLMLVPINRAVLPFYQRLGFEIYDGGEKMFLPLQSAVAAVADEWE